MRVTRLKLTTLNNIMKESQFIKILALKQDFRNDFEVLNWISTKTKNVKIAKSVYDFVKLNRKLNLN